MRKLILVLLVGLCLQAGATAEKSQPVRKNILLFTVDSCRADRFGLYGYRNATTPNIDAWARTGTAFTEAYSTSAWTAPGLASILTGLYPPTHGINNRDTAGTSRLLSLNKFFRERGYKVPNINFFTFAPYYRNLGLGPIENQYLSQTPGEEIGKWLKQNASASQPFFVWYHCTTIHQPYNPPDTELPAPREELMKSPGIKAVMSGAIVPTNSTRFQDADRPVLNALYDGELRRLDRIFKSALDALAEQGVLRNTIVILTADHGEELLDHGFVGHASTSLNAKLYQELVRIPLIISCPGLVPSGRRISRAVDQTDIFPTLLKLLSLEPLAHLQGQPLFSGRERPHFFESVIAGNQTTREREHIWVRGVLDKGHKYISTGELYDLRKDPQEKSNLHASRPELVTRLKTQLDEWLGKTTSLRAQLFPPDPRPARPDSLTAPAIFTPENGKRLDYEVHTGALLFDWSGNMETTYVVQYDIGTGDHHVEGTYEAKGNHQVLGPFSRELWENLKAWNPFKIRVSPKTDPPVWSAWTTFEF